MVDIKNILSKAKLSRTDLSHVYKNIKQLKLNISWLDLLRTTSRENTLNKLKEALEPKPIKVKKSTKKDKLKALFESIKNAKPEAEQYLVLTINFTDNTTKHATITPQSKAKIMQDILNEVTDKEHLGGSGFSDATLHRIKGKQIKDFSLQTRNKFEVTQKNLFKKNTETRINKKRTGGFFPFTHRIENEYVEAVLEQLQIFKTGVLPDNPNVCFIESIKDQIPEDIVEKIKYDIRSEYVPTTTGYLRTRILPHCNIITTSIIRRCTRSSKSNPT